MLRFKQEIFPFLHSHSLSTQLDRLLVKSNFEFLPSDCLWKRLKEIQHDTEPPLSTQLDVIPLTDKPLEPPCQDKEKKKVKKKSKNKIAKILFKRPKRWESDSHQQAETPWSKLTTIRLRDHRMEAPRKNFFFSELDHLPHIYVTDFYYVDTREFASTQPGKTSLQQPSRRFTHSLPGEREKKAGNFFVRKKGTNFREKILCFLWLSPSLGSRDGRQADWREKRTRQGEKQRASVQPTQPAGKCYTLQPERRKMNRLPVQINHPAGSRLQAQAKNDASEPGPGSSSLLHPEDFRHSIKMLILYETTVIINERTSWFKSLRDYFRANNVVLLYLSANVFILWPPPPLLQLT